MDKMKTKYLLPLAIGSYAIAMILANLSAATWGPKVTPINAFILIGFDLTMRDWLHVRIKAWQMGALIGLTGLFTYVLNPSAGSIAIASATAFTVAAVVDWSVFSTLKGSWWSRSNWSNVAGAAVDSMIFPMVAFGAFLPMIVAGQFTAKVLGGAVWGWVFMRMRKFMLHSL